MFLDHYYYLVYYTAEMHKCTLLLCHNQLSTIIIMYDFHSPSGKKEEKTIAISEYQQTLIEEEKVMCIVAEPCAANAHAIMYVLMQQ